MLTSALETSSHHASLMHGLMYRVEVYRRFYLRLLGGSANAKPKTKKAADKYQTPNNGRFFGLNVMMSFVL